LKIATHLKLAAAGCSAIVLLLNIGCRHPQPGKPVVHTVPTPQPTGPPPLPPLPEGGVRGIHVTGWIAGGKNSLNKLLELSDRTEINALAIDIIDNGQLSYDSDVPLAKSTKASQRMFKVDRVIEAINQHKVWPIARIACMRNTPLAESHPELAIHNANGKVWHDGSGYAWLNPYKHEVWDYSVDLAMDAIKHGFKEIQFDYVRFPSYHVSTQVFPDRPAGAKKEDQIVDFVKYGSIEYVHRARGFR